MRFAALVILIGTGAATCEAMTISAAHYAEPVTRYGHFALGTPHEYARLIVRTDSGRERALVLPDDEVFEDLRPRIVKLHDAAEPALLTIISHRHRGARLALIELRDARLTVAAESRAIGTPMRWLNPVGVADLDGDGQAEIAAVITPHIGGTLTVYRRAGNELLAVASLGGFSNHVYRSAQLALSGAVAIDSRNYLLVPDMTRRALRIIAWMDGRLVERGRCALDEPLIDALHITGDGKITADGLNGGQPLAVRRCLH